MMALFPQHNVGFFISFNTDKGGGVYLDVLDEFMTRYFPEATPAAPLKVTRDYLAQFAGKYRANRQNHSDLTSLASMLGDITITTTDSTSLRVQSGERVSHLVPIDSLVFREKNSNAVYSFEKVNGVVARMFIGNMPIFALDKVSGLKSAELHMFIFVAAILMGVLALFFWPFVALSRIGYQSHRFTKPMPLNARLIAWLNYFILLVFYLGVAANANEEGIVYGISTALKVFLYFPFLNLLLTAIMLYWLVKVITVRYHRTVSKLYYTLLCLTSLAALWQLYYWNMFGA
jgi:hypothetical protein